MQALLVRFLLSMSVLLSAANVWSDDRPQREAQGFAACADQGEFPELRGSLCTSFTAPLDSPATDGQTIELFVRKIPASIPATGSLWLVSGGPGESGASLYPFVAPLQAAFPGFDLLIPDHRGTGYSTRLCPTEEARDSAGGLSLEGAEWRSCWQSLNGTPDYARAFSVTHAARDLAALIERYSGSKRVYVYAVSYGTQLALRTIQIYRPRIDGLILDSLVPPETTTRWDLSRRSEIVDEVGRKVLDQCDHAVVCRTTIGGSAATAYRQVLETKDEALLSQIPGKDLKVFFGGLLDFPATRARIPALIAELNRGETTSLGSVKNQLVELGKTFGRYPQAALSIPLVSIISASENNARPDLTKQQVVAEQGSLLFASSLPGLLVDPGLPLYQRDASFGKLPARLPRTLVVHGTLDPKTPFAGALEQVKQLKTAGKVTLVPAIDTPHFVMFTAPECFAQAARSFLRGRTAVQAPACSKPEGSSVAAGGL